MWTWKFRASGDRELNMTGDGHFGVHGKQSHEIEMGLRYGIGRNNEH
jgi:hypothetical protein